MMDPNQKWEKENKLATNGSRMGTSQYSSNPQTKEEISVPTGGLGTRGLQASFSMHAERKNGQHTGISSSGLNPQLYGTSLHAIITQRISPTEADFI